MRVVCVSKTLDSWIKNNCQRLYVKKGNVGIAEKRERQDKHSNMYALESEFGSEQMGDIATVLEYVRSCTPAYVL